MNPCQEEIKRINSKIWHACAGSLVTLPPEGAVVVYFPQGHIEQVAASMQKDVDAQIPNCLNLPSELICSVLNVTLHTDTETEEVYAQMTLQPVSSFHKDLSASHLALKSAKPQTEFFCKTLTPSDTNIHGSLSLPRRATEKILPPLDYSMLPPAQELVARDLHDKEWTFCHIYRAKAKRHFLTTGWSQFVSRKGLISGDSLLFIRDVKQQLLLGIRRANRQPTLYSSDSMLREISAAAANYSPFTVFYYPRTSPSEFVIPLAKYYNAVHNTQISSSMQFRMKFETEESEKPRYMSTIIVGMNDLDPVQWKNSNWRNLQVVCDEEGRMQKRVSIWEIEPMEAPLSLCPQPFVKSKYPKKLRISDVPLEIHEHIPHVGFDDLLEAEIGAALPSSPLSYVPSEINGIPVKDDPSRNVGENLSEAEIGAVLPSSHLPDFSSEIYGISLADLLSGDLSGNVEENLSEAQIGADLRSSPLPDFPSEIYGIPVKDLLNDDLPENVGENLWDAQIEALHSSSPFPDFGSEMDGIPVNGLFNDHLSGNVGENLSEVYFGAPLPLFSSKIHDHIRRFDEFSQNEGKNLWEAHFEGEAPDKDFKSSFYTHVAPPTEINVEKYLTNHELSPIWQAIFNRYGNTYSECNLEGICKVIASMQQKTLNTLTRDDLSKWKDAVKDSNGVGVMRPLLMLRIDELSSALEVHERLYGVKEERTENLYALNVIREVEGDSKSELVEAKAKLEAAKVRVASLEEEVASLESKCQHLEEQRRDIKRRYDPVFREAEVFKHFVNGDLAQGLL